VTTTLAILFTAGLSLAHRSDEGGRHRAKQPGRRIDPTSAQQNETPGMKPPPWLPYIWAKMRARLAKLGETTKVDIVAHLCIRRLFWQRKFRRESGGPGSSHWLYPPTLSGDSGWPYVYVCTPPSKNGLYASNRCGTLKQCMFGVFGVVWGLFLGVCDFQRRAAAPISSS
jgi:hypothetical protein